MSLFKKGTIVIFCRVTFLSAVLLICGFGCREPNRSSDSFVPEPVPDSVSLQKNSIRDTAKNSEAGDRLEEKKISKVNDRNNSENADNNLKNLNAEIFKNENSDGYGYNIFMDGKLYVHQPNIPALQGNRGFASEEQARRVSSLVIEKINKHILPPTISVSELDSLGIK